MARSKLVNLDAMIARADFATEMEPETAYESISNISLRDFLPGALIGPNLRKPDFQRETNHWGPEQVVSLLDCFVNGDLIPSVILWKSPTYVFVIDGGHRLSVLRAWVADDYGDGPLSLQFFGNEISQDQKSAAKRTREMIESRIGTFKHIQARLEQSDLPAEERRRASTVVSRALQIQWVTGNADKAESSFFRINTEGTPLDEIEELLLRSRHRPIPICARAVIRAGKGHRYWSSFEPVRVKKIEGYAQELHQVLFEPDLKSPVKTLDLPLGGSKGIRTALQVLIDFMLIASRNQKAEPKKVEDQPEDTDGAGTEECLRRSLRLAKRITGNDSGSLGLHPAVYFYGPTGRHSGSMFMGTVSLIGRKLSNNDSGFFAKFTQVRSELESVLVFHKELIATILQKHSSFRRTGVYERILEGLIDRASSGESVTEEWLIDRAELRGKIVSGHASSAGTRFSEDVKSGAFISTALSGVPKCSVCRGYLDANKSISYDHINPVRAGGTGESDNCQLTHPYCNQSVKQ